MPDRNEVARIPSAKQIKGSKKKLDGEFFAIRKLLKALDPLTPGECSRVLAYIKDFTGLPICEIGSWDGWVTRKADR
jgi:hypothetical protein